jgi:hypothetical protein
MKPAFLLLTLSLVAITSGAHAQGKSDACHDQYGSCMERCHTRPESLRASCSSSCEANTNTCYSGMYGGSSSAQTIQVTPEQASASEPEARAAQDEVKPKKTKKK